MAKLKLSEKDIEIIKELREYGVLKNVESDHIKSPKEYGGEILIMCSDGDQFIDMFHHRIHKTGLHVSNHRIHPIAVAGGPLLLSKKSPIHDNFVISQVEGAIKLKEIENVVLYGHAPCGAPTLIGASLSVLQLIELLILGEERLLSKYPDLRTKRYFHVDDGKKRTYFVSIENWKKYRKDVLSVVNQDINQEINSGLNL